VPADLDPAIAEETLAAAARLIRRFHDATAGTAVAGDDEVVCHHDLSPCNFVFRDGDPVGIIDFDLAAPGTRRQDVGMAIFLWLNLGTDGPEPTEQAARMRVFCRAYGTDANADVVDAVIVVVAHNVHRLETDGRVAEVEWWDKQRRWLDERRDELVRALTWS
jgi:Ser/Thr protein kinase RdoA (MazF antagonist)